MAADQQDQDDAAVVEPGFDVWADGGSRLSSGRYRGNRRPSRPAGVGTYFFAPMAGAIIGLAVVAVGWMWWVDTHPVARDSPGHYVGWCIQGDDNRFDCYRVR